MSRKSWLVGFVIVLALLSPARAADSWVAMEVRGSVLALIEGEWQELATGDPVASGVAVRTLQAGRVVLRRSGEVLQLDPNTTVRPSSSNGATTIEQYSGTLSMLEPGRGTSKLVTPTLVAVPSSASLVSRLTGGATNVSVRNGTVELSENGRRLLLRAGQTYLKQGGEPGVTSGNRADAPNSASGEAAGQSPSNLGDQGAAGAGTSSSTDGGGDEQGDSTKHDNGVGNGGTPGNGGQNGNAGGNGNGQHKGNSK